MANVSTPSPAYDKLEQRRKLCRDLMGGTSAMRLGTTLYLLKFDSEDEADYSVRLRDSFLTPFFSEAVGGVVGRMFAEPLVLSDDTPPQVVKLWDDIDLKGTQADVFLYRVMLDAVPNGMSWVLVDGPAPSEGGALRTVADEAKDGARPFRKHYLAQDVIETLYIIEKGKARLQRLRVKVCVDVADGEWGSKTVERIIVYRRGNPQATGNDYFASYETHQKAVSEKGEETWSVLPELSGPFLPPLSASLDLRKRFINLPLVPFPVSEDGDPPLRDGLAELCLQHWRKKSILDNAICVANWMQMVYNGSMADFVGANSASITTDDTKTLNKRELRVGPMGLLCTGAPDRSLAWLSHDGVSMGTAQSDLERLEQQIRQAANDPYQRRPTGDETATSQLLADGKNRTQAQVWATLCESSADECLEWTSAWLGLEQSGSVTFGRKAMASLADGSDFAHVLTLFEKGEIDGDAMIEEARRYGVLGPDVERAADAEQRAQERKQMRQGLAARLGPGPTQTQGAGAGAEPGSEDVDEREEGAA